MNPVTNALGKTWGQITAIPTLLGGQPSEQTHNYTYQAPVPEIAPPQFLPLKRGQPTTMDNILQSARGLLGNIGSGMQNMLPQASFEAFRNPGGFNVTAGADMSNVGGGVAGGMQNGSPYFSSSLPMPGNNQLTNNFGNGGPNGMQNTQFQTTPHPLMGALLQGLQQGANAMQGPAAPINNQVMQFIQQAAQGLGQKFPNAVGSLSTALPGNPLTTTTQMGQAVGSTNQMASQGQLPTMVPGMPSAFPQAYAAGGTGAGITDSARTSTDYFQNHAPFINADRYFGIVRGTPSKEEFEAVTQMYKDRFKETQDALKRAKSNGGTFGLNDPQALQDVVTAADRQQAAANTLKNMYSVYEGGGKGYSAYLTFLKKQGIDTPLDTSNVVFKTIRERMQSGGYQKPEEITSLSEPQ